MSLSYFTIKQTGEAELIEKKSRFIGYAAPVNNEAEATAFIEAVRAKHRDATHNCYAYQAGEHNECQRSSDAGEPAGTAGRPILEVIKKSELKNTAVVVTRYFGGVLLGAGGLVRAYSKAAALALAEAGLVQRRAAHAYSLTIDYNLWGKVENLLKQPGCAIQETSFMEKITVFCVVELDWAPEFLEKLKEIGNGTITILPLTADCWLDREIEPGAEPNE